MMRWRTLLTTHVLLSLAALAVAAPFVTMAGAAVRTRPEGDLAYWAGGGEIAADALIRLGPFFPAMVRLSLGAACIWALLAPLATALLLDAHHQGTDPGVSRLAVAARNLWGAFLAQRAAHVGALVLAVATGAACLQLADAWSAAWPSAARQGLLRVGVLLPALVLALFANAATDLAHALTTRGSRGPLRTWLAALRWAALHPIRTMGAYVLTIVAMGLLTLVVAMLADRLGGAPGLPFLALLLAQQAVALARTALRSAWLETALGLTGVEAGAYAPGLPRG